jgi:hypothetical protein
MELTLPYLIRSNRVRTKGREGKGREGKGVTVQYDIIINKERKGIEK